MSVTIILIIVTGIVTYMGFQDHRIFEKYKFSVAGIQSGEYYRFITSAFLHADWNHFAFNMFTLYFFGDFLNTYFGPKRFLLIYFAGVIAGNYISYYFHKKDLWYAAIGASAGVNAALFAFITLYPFKLIFLFAIIPVPALLFGILYLWYTSKESLNTRSNIGHEAHFGGALTGVAFALFFSFKNAFSAHPLNTSVLILALLGGFIYMKKNKLLNFRKLKK